MAAESAAVWARPWATRGRQRAAAMRQATISWESRGSGIGSIAQAEPDPVRLPRQARFSGARETARRNLPHRHHNIPIGAISAPTPQHAHAGVDMSEGWLRRLRSSGVGFAFALGLLSAGLLQLPFQSSAQQPAVPALDRHPEAAGRRGLAPGSERSLCLGRRARQAERRLHQVRPEARAPRGRGPRNESADAGASRIRGVLPGHAADAARSPGSRKAPARDSSSPRTATSSPTTTWWTARTR